MKIEQGDFIEAKGASGTFYARVKPGSTKEPAENFVAYLYATYKGDGFTGFKILDNHFGMFANGKWEVAPRKDLLQALIPLL